MCGPSCKSGLLHQQWNLLFFIGAIKRGEEDPSKKRYLLEMEEEGERRLKIRHSLNAKTPEPDQHNTVAFTPTAAKKKIHLD